MPSECERPHNRGSFFPKWRGLRSCGLNCWTCCVRAAPFTFQTLSVGPPLARVLQKCTAASRVENKMGGGLRSAPLVTLD
jgi:hypothetical protein